MVAFVALFVRLSGSHLWGTLCYIIHQFRATPHSKDGLSHQVQVTLNNTSSDAGMLWDLIKLTWTWRRASRSALARCLPLMMVATFHIVAFAIAGIFSSQVTTVGDEALVQSQYCGWMDEVPGLWSTEISSTQSQIDIMNSLGVTARVELSEELSLLSWMLSRATRGTSVYLQHLFSATNKFGHRLARNLSICFYGL